MNVDVLEGDADVLIMMMLSNPEEDCCGLNLLWHQMIHLALGHEDSVQHVNCTLELHSRIICTHVEISM